MTTDDLLYRPGVAGVLCLKAIDRELTKVSREICDVRARSAALAVEAQELLDRAHALNARRFEEACGLETCDGCGDE